MSSVNNISNRSHRSSRCWGNGCAVARGTGVLGVILSKNSSGQKSRKYTHTHTWNSRLSMTWGVCDLIMDQTYHNSTLWSAPVSQRQKVVILGMKQGFWKYKHTPICSFHYMTCGRLDSETDINMFSWKLAIRTSIEQFVANEKAILSRHDSIQSIAVSCHVHHRLFLDMILSHNNCSCIYSIKASQ